jgi:Sec-independent protein translocase protein TatA
LTKPPGSADRETPRGASEAPELGQQARAAVDDVKREAHDAAEQAKHKARTAATTQKDVAAQHMGGFAHALNTASEDLRESGQELTAEYVRKAAGGLEHVSDVMRERDVDQLLGTVEDFARRQPVAFLGAAVMAGFGIARLMKSSADRRHGAAASVGPRAGSVA